MPHPAELALAHGFTPVDLYERDGLVKLDERFLAHLGAAAPELLGGLLGGRADPSSLAAKAESELLLALAPHVEDFVGELFGVTAAVADLRARADALAPLYDCKRLFVRRRAVKGRAGASASDGPALERAVAALLGEPVTEESFARAVMAWLADEPTHVADLALAERFAAWAATTPQGHARFAGGFLFRLPHKIEPDHLVPVEAAVIDGVTVLRLPEDRLRRREGFALTDAGMSPAAALDQAHYCIFCHNQGKDSCAKGFKDKAKEFRANALGITLAGCPLEEKISEMNLLASQGFALGAVAIAAVDNPLMAATGHRICNDCMKACIYQKQEPVDIPQIETRALKDVLALPWGFEIYGLLTRWNPLNLRRPLPLPPSGQRVLVVGLGPAGFSLAHTLLNDGHTVVAVDGLKIEPLAPALSGVAADGARVPFQAVRRAEDLREPLDDRLMAGFGGVAEYGITVRWDKNFLKIVRLLLERRGDFAMFGGVRLGGNMTVDQAFDLGFDHVALAVGAGKPTYLDLPGGLARGVRAASDFLMALQLTGAAKRDSVANLQIRLPVVVVGGGLTAVDTATEALAYYPVQVEKFLARFETLAAEGRAPADFDAEEQSIADEFLAHARALRAVKGEPRRIKALLDSWGGVTLAYRRRMQDAPSYRLNHEEVAKALEEGIRFAPGLAPVEVAVDEHGHAAAITFACGADRVTLPARSILVAAGTQPNTVIAREDADRFATDGLYLRAVDGTPEKSTKPSTVRAFAHVRADGRAVSFLGDVHPSYAGNVVKAMASGKQVGALISRRLAGRAPASGVGNDPFIGRLNDGLRARVHAVNRLTPTIVEVVVHAPFAARAFKPGQFFRLQNYEARALRADGTTLAMEGLAMTGAWVDGDLLGLIVLEMGGSSDLCSVLEPGEPVIVMGPTGTATEILAGETVVLVGGGLGNAVLFAIGQRVREMGGTVLYFAGYKRAIDRYKVAEIEAAADAIVWACDEAPGFRPNRPQDKAIVGNLVAAMRAYAEGGLGETPIPLAAADRLIAIGSDRMMAAVAAARRGVLKGHLARCRHAIGSINSPMQCMMKEICAQCLQPHRDPVTGERLPPVFSCFNQDQPLDRVDFDGLAARLRQNSVQEKLTRRWIDRTLRRLARRPAAE
ncbi:MAG: pyridine nucleotide-disulfide oxidoreductase [Alphaproteobacteria bacterium]|nr:pyridine nucleotide-disulfide oxidoreductase [Alphaproteobacteria bacterium]